MLSVKPVDEVRQFILEYFGESQLSSELITLGKANGRVLSEDIIAPEYVPGFTRSSVDGYAVHAADTFGCSESIPAMLGLKGEVTMGEAAGLSLSKGECCYVPTGGALPDNADAMVMIEFADVFSDGIIAINKPSAPGNGLIFKGDDVKPGDIILKKGQRLMPKDIGSLAAMGIVSFNVFKKPRVAVISTGDELISPEETPEMGQIRDVNENLLTASLISAGAEAVTFGIIEDDPVLLKQIVKQAAETCDMVLISGGTSVGQKDSTAVVMEELGKLLVHGLALKPGKPTIVAEVNGKPIFGLPGHPVAAYFVFELLVKPILSAMTNSLEKPVTVRVNLAANIPSNHGREECIAVTIKDNKALPITTKSGLITALSKADGYIRIPRDCEGLKENSSVDVLLF